jgi:hypothetical protein
MAAPVPEMAFCTQFKMRYQPRGNLVKDENGDVLADFHNILNRRKNNFPVIECALHQ